MDQLDGRRRAWRRVGAVAAALVGAPALAAGLLAAWASVSLLLDRGPANDEGWSTFIGWLLAPFAVVGLILGGGLLLIARRVWRETR